MDFKLNESQRQYVEAVRALAQNDFKPRAAKYMDGTFPWENMKQLAEIGVLGMTVSEQYGGLGLPVFETALILEEIAKVCYPTAMAVLGEAGVQTRIIETYAPDSIKNNILPKVCSGDAILSICMTEPHAGTDVSSYRTNTRLHMNHATVNGVKTLISRAQEAAMFVVFTRVDDQPGREGIGCVLIEGGTPGLEVTASYHTMGGEYLHEVRFDNVEVPLENVVLKEGGFRKLMSAFNTQRCLNPSISLGLAEGAFEEAVNYTRNRPIFGKTLTDFQGLRWKLAEMYRDIEAARSVLYRACASANPFPDPFLAAVAKITCNEMALRVTNDALQLHGGYGFTDEYPVSRLYRGARYGSLGGGATETLKDLIAKRILDGMDPTEGILSFNNY
jgi:alkylation response protein AidB-like acyl-CoA dehydrogenase